MSFGFILLIIIALALLVGSGAVVASMAKRRGRSVIGWVAVTFFALPFAILLSSYSGETDGLLWFGFSFFASWPLGIILLLCLGETEEKRKERLEEEALIKWQVWDRQNRLKQKEEDTPKQELPSQEPISGSQPTHTGKTINDLYKKNK